ncbi:unnamed protein product, partial [Brugia timori]|uniref:NFACT-R_1 domain-containing protein n=1 Tax=Brugia timori TaxID=42155 RepID=A0A0R3RDE6_9BILA
QILVYGSVWASWSAWSFCVNKVRVRVRACNTVRGFSCLGKKQEFMECDLDYMQPAVQESDYTAVDPWEEDRKEAMKQLYSHKYSSDQSEKVNSDENKNKFIPRESEIRRRERGFIIFYKFYIKIKSRKNIFSKIIYYY